MHYLKRSLAYLILTISTFTTFTTIQPITQASTSQSIQSQAKATNWFLQGIQKANQQDYQGALLDFTQAIQNNPQYAEAYYQQGLIYAQYAQGKPLNLDGTALGCKKKDNYIIICPFEFKDRIKENRQKAIKDFTQAIQINPQYAAAYHQRGLVEDEQNQKTQDFQRAIELYLQKSKVSLEQHNYNQTADLLETIDKIYAELKFLTTQSLVENKQTEESPTNSSTISPDIRNAPEVLMSEASQALRKGDLPTAIQTYKQAALIWRERKDSRYNKVQEIIREIEQIAHKS